MSEANRERDEGRMENGKETEQTGAEKGEREGKEEAGNLKRC